MDTDERTSRVTFLPNSHPAPRGLTAHVSISSGSDHIRSEKSYQESVESTLVGTDHRRLLHGEFLGHEIVHGSGLEFVCLVIGHRGRTESLHLLSTQDMRPL